jgi:hypothetical protein
MRFLFVVGVAKQRVALELEATKAFGHLIG